MESVSQKWDQWVRSGVSEIKMKSVVNSVQKVKQITHRNGWQVNGKTFLDVLEYFSTFFF
jgi:hypothetical protein